MLLLVCFHKSTVIIPLSFFLAGSPDDYYVLNDPLRVPLSATLPRPYTDPTHRRQLLQSSNVQTVEPKWGCPLSLNAVLERGNPSSACPLPSAHDGYTAPLSSSSANRNDAVDSNHAAAAAASTDIVREVARMPLTCASSSSVLPAPGAFTQELEALGAYPELARALQSSMTEHVRTNLCESWSQHHQQRDGGSSGSVHHQSQGEEVAIAWSLVPGYVVMLRGVGSNEGASSGEGSALESATIPAKVGAAAYSAATMGGAAAMRLAGDAAAAAAVGTAPATAAASSTAVADALALSVGDAIGRHMRAVCQYIATDEVRGTN